MRGIGRNLQVPRAGGTGRRFVALWLLAGLSAVAAAQEPPPAAPGDVRVVRIRFEGNRRYTDEFLKEQIATKEGQVYDSGLIARDERVLRRFFASVLDTIETQVEGGLEIVFVVLDKVVVGKVSYTGLARVRKDDFEPLLATRAGRPLLEHSLETDRELIGRLHRQKGYRFVEVNVRRVPTRKADVEDVVFEILAGPRVRVQEVVLEGAHSVEKKELLKIIKNSDRYRRQFLGLGKIFNPSWYDRAALEQDRRRMEVYYEREGWLDARVVYVDTRFEDRRSRAVVKFRVDEGTRYRLRSLKVEFAPGGGPREDDRAFLDPDALANLSLLEFQEPFRLEDLAQTKRLISERLWERAYARNTIADVITRDADLHVVDVRLVITSGPKVKLGRFRPFGNKWTRDNVIRRQFRKGALPGDDLDIEALEAGRTRLGGLRYFSLIRFGDGRDPWGLTKDPNAPGDDIWDVELEVEETDTRQFSIGAGVSTDGGAFGQFSVTWRNFDIGRPPSSLWRIFDQDSFRGGGQRFTLSAAPGTTFSTFLINFYDPAVRDSRWSFDTSIFSRISRFDDYDVSQDGIAIAVGRFLDEDFIWNLTFDWSLRQVVLDNPDSSAPVNALDEQGTSAIHGVGVTLTRRRTREADAFLNGHVTTLSATVFGGALGADVDVVKASFQHRAGWRLWKQRGGGWHRLRVHFAISWAGAYDETPQVPVHERYFLGGRNLRGFRFREVGPRSNDSPTGGEFIGTVSLQYTLPLTDREDAGFGLDLIFFVDQGTLVEDFGDLRGDLWRVSAGFGLAIGFGSPVQPPLLIDFGWPLLREPGDRLQVLSIAFERNF